MAHDDDRRAACLQSDSTPSCPPHTPQHKPAQSQSVNPLAKDSASRLSLTGHALDISPWAQVPRDDLDQESVDHKEAGLRTEPLAPEPFRRNWLVSHTGSRAVVGGLTFLFALTAIVLTTWKRPSLEPDVPEPAADRYGTPPVPTRMAVAARGMDPPISGARVSTTPTGTLAPDGTELTTEELQSISAYGSACDMGETTACVALGALYAQHRANGERVYLPEAAQLFRKACEGGNAVGCNNLGIMFLDPVGAFDDTAILGNAIKKIPTQVDKAVAMFDRACNAGNSDGCNNLGAMYERGAGVAQDFGAARRLYTKACDWGMSLGCSNLASLYSKHESLGGSPAETERLFLKACEGGNTRACINLAEYSNRMHAN